MLNKIIQWIKNWRYNMAATWASLIMYGLRDFSQVPKRLKEQVREILITLECEELIDE